MKDHTIQEKILWQLHLANALTTRAAFAERRAQRDKKEGCGDKPAGMHAGFGASAMWGGGMHGGYGEGRAFSFGTKRSQVRLLSILLGEDGVAIKDLVERLDARPSSVGELVSKLEAKGYVKREINEDDKRSVKVYITEEGKKKAHAIKEGKKEATEKILGALDAQEQETFLALLKKLNTALKEQMAEYGEETAHRGCSDSCSCSEEKEDVE